jgi:hypothetical protein
MDWKPSLVISDRQGELVLNHFRAVSAVLSVIVHTLVAADVCSDVELVDRLWVRELDTTAGATLRHHCVFKWVPRKPVLAVCSDDIVHAVDAEPLVRGLFDAQVD